MSFCLLSCFPGKCSPVKPGQAAHSVACLTQEPEVPGSILGPTTYFHFSFHPLKKDSCQLKGKVCHEVLINRLGGLSLPRKSVVRLIDHPDMTIDVYHGCKTTT